MTGIMMAGVGAGQAVVPPAMTRLIAIEGWRTSLLVLGLLSLTVIVVAAQFLRREPGQAEQPSSAGQNGLEQKALITDADGLSRHEALRTVPLWVLCAAYFCYDFVLQGTIVHIVPHATDLGISAMAAANILLSSA